MRVFIRTPSQIVSDESFCARQPCYFSRRAIFIVFVPPVSARLADRPSNSTQLDVCIIIIIINIHDTKCFVIICDLHGNVSYGHILLVFIQTNETRDSSEDKWRVNETRVRIKCTIKILRRRHYFNDDLLQDSDSVFNPKTAMQYFLSVFIPRNVL